MKLKSNIKVDIKGKILGGEKFLYCISIRPGDKIRLLEDAKEAMSFNPDIVEWRIDYFNPMLESDYIADLIIGDLKELSEILGNTFRRQLIH